MSIVPSGTIEEGLKKKSKSSPSTDDDLRAHPDHLLHWEPKYKDNPMYAGPADLAINPESQGPDRNGRTKRIRYWANWRSGRRMRYKPNFYTWKKARRYADRSCCILKTSNPCRRWLVKFVTSWPFENFILLAVILNTVFIMLPSYNYKTVDPFTYEPLSLTDEGCCDMLRLPNMCNETNLDTLCRVESCGQAKPSDGTCCECPAVNMVVSSTAAEWIFLGIFLVEMILKMFAFGVLPGPPSWYGSYFTDGWNLLDFFIVMAALIGAPFPGPDGLISIGPSLGFLRVIRVLRPLRSLSIIPSMRRMVSTLLVSISELLAVLMLLCFIFLMFGALMIQVYSGQLRYTCRHTNFPLQLPTLSMSSDDYNSRGISWKNVTEVNWCTYHDDWEQTGPWSSLFPTCDSKDNVFANTRHSTMHDEVFYHRLEHWPIRATASPMTMTNKSTRIPLPEGMEYGTQYFYFDRAKDWHRMHRWLMLNASSLAGTTDPYQYSAEKYKIDLLQSSGVFKPCTDDQGRIMPISFEQCNRICYNQQVRGSGLRENPCTHSPNSVLCEVWTTRSFDKYTPNSTMCAQYCPKDGPNWDLLSLKTPKVSLNSPWRNVTAASMPFYNGHRLCFWPNDNGDTRSANRYCSGWFESTYDSAQGHNRCPAHQYCGSDFDPAGNRRFHTYDIINAAIYKEDLLWGIPQFNNFPQAFLSIFQSITLEGWVDILYTVADRMSFTTTAVVFIVMVFIGGLFLLNMTLAVISEAFNAQQEKEEVRKLKLAEERLTKTESQRELVPNEKRVRTPVPCVQKTCLCCGTVAGHKDSKNPCFKALHSFVTGAVFELVILACIFVNFIVLCLDFYRAPFVLQQVLEYINFVLTMIFVVEMVLKLIGLGLRDYFKNNWNMFDFAIVVFSLIEYCLAPPTFLNIPPFAELGGGLTVFRTFRVFRVFKLAQGWKHLQEIISVLGRSLKDVVLFFLLLSIFIVIFAVWGLQLFSNRFRFDPITGRPVSLQLDPDTMLPTADYENADIPDSNFDSLYQAILTVFQICSGENWNAVMYDGMRSHGWDAVLFFLMMIFILVMIVLELFVAILLGHFDDMDDDDDDDDDDNEGNNDFCCCIFLIGPKQEEDHDALGSLTCCPKKKSVAVAPEGIVEPETPEQRFKRLAVDGPLRTWLASLSLEEFTFAFFQRGITKVEDFKTLVHPATADSIDLERMGLSQIQIDNIQEKRLDEQALKSGCNMLATEELTLLRVQKAEYTLKQLSEAKKEAGESDVDLISDLEKQSNSQTKELDKLQAKLTPDTKACCCLPRNNCRIAFNGIVEYPGFDNLILLCILLSTALLMIETPLMMKPGHWVSTSFNIANWIFAWIFIVEMILKIIAKGFLLHKNAYLRNAWNVLDFLIVLVSIVLMSLDVLSWAQINVGSLPLGALRALRAGRALRPLRSIRRRPELRVIVLALIRSFPSVMQTLLVVGIFFIIFAVMGVNYFKGGFMECDLSGLVVPDGMEQLVQCVEGNSLSEAKCKLWTDLSSSERLSFIDGSANAADKAFTKEYNQGVVDWGNWSNVYACDLSLYISNSITNWTDPGPKCAMKMTGERLFGQYEYMYYLKQNLDTYLHPTSRNICEWVGGGWTLYGNVPQSFNNVLLGLMTWFELSTTEGWVDAMYAATAYRGVDMQSMPVDMYDDADFFARYVPPTLLFVLFIIFGTFLLTNLFVGTVCNVFQKMRMHNDQAAVFMTEAQKEWQRRQKTVMRLQPFLKPKVPEAKSRRKLFTCVTSSAFETFIFMCILVNTFILMVRFFPTLLPQYWQVAVATEIANILFAFIFTVEAIVKLAALGQQYFCKKDCRSKKQGKDGKIRTSCTCSYVDSWNVFDFLIVIGTIFGLAIKYGVGFSGINAITTIIRTFRVARIFRLVKHQYLRKLKVLLQTVGLSLPSILNLAIVLLLFLVIFAILGVQLFAGVEHNDALNDHANFQNFPVAILTLFRGTTGENWNGIMHALSRSSTNCSASVEWNERMCGFCEWNQIYTTQGDDLKCVECEPLNGCGQPLWAEFFFMIFTFLITYMIMNIFVAVILEAYEQSCLDESAVVTEDDLRAFSAEWSELDPDASMTIPLSVLPRLMDSLPHPMGFKIVKKTEVTVVDAEFVESKNLVVFPNNDILDEDEVVKVSDVAKNAALSQSMKQEQIDEMGIHSYEENGDAQVRFRDILFACVQRAYKNDDPSTAFSIDLRHRTILQDETKTMSAVPIKTSHYLSALRIAQAYRAHKFRNNFIGMQKMDDGDPDRNNRDTREAFAEDGER